MALDRFKKRKDQPTAEGGADAGADTTEAEGPRSNPAKARQFFDHAHAVHQTGNYAYAMTLWLQGLRQDPSDAEGLERFFESAGRFAQGQRKPSPTKDQAKSFVGRGAVDRYLLALLHWGVRPMEVGLGLKAMDAAVRSGANESAYWVGAKVLAVAANNPKSKKDTFIQLMKLFQKCGAHDRAVLAGEQALRKDPTDHALDTTLRNLSAQATMNRAGFEQTGAAGGFRANVRDMSVQQEIEEEERIVKTEEVQERSIERAKTDYESRPTDNAAIQKLAKVLRERGRNEDLKLAYKVLMKGFKANQNYRFRVLAGDIRLIFERRKVLEVRKRLETSPTDEAAQRALAEAERNLLDEEVKEFKERVANLPTDLMLRYELARRCLQVGDYETAIDNFQAAVDLPQVAQKSRRGLAEAFSGVGWVEEAESTYRIAIEEHQSETDPTATNLRYGLMRVLQTKAAENQDLPAAEEAFKLASGIAIRQIGFKDVRQRRNEIQELVKELKAATA